MGREFDGQFDYGSILPTTIFVFGLISIYLFVTEQYSEGFFAMILSFVLYIIDNLFVKNDSQGQSDFNAFLDNMATFVAFGVSSIAFASVFFITDEDNYLILLPIFFFSITALLGLARNWTLDTKNTKGWPIAFNGICLPLMYYMYRFYFQGWESVILIYFIIVGILSASSHNFLGFEDNNKRKNRNNSSYVDDEDLEGYVDISKNKQLGIKQATNFYKKQELVPKKEVEYVDDVSENEESIKDIEDVKVNQKEIPKENKTKIDEVKKEEIVEEFSDDEYIDDVSDNPQKLDEILDDEEFIDDISEKDLEVKTDIQNVAQVPAIEDKNNKPKHKPFFKSLFNLKVFKREDAPVLDDEDFPSKKELKETLKENDKTEVVESKDKK